MKYLATLGLACLLLTGCNAQQTALSVSNVITGILNIVQAEIPQLPATDQAGVQGFITLGQNLNAQAISCEMAAGGTKTKLATCLTTFASGLLSPAEMAQLRILSAAAQRDVTIGAGAAIIAINGIMTQWGQPVLPTPVIGTAAPATTVELYAIEKQLWDAGYPVPVFYQ
jgi:hypothetical protein